MVPTALLGAAATIGDGLQRLGWANPPMTSFRLRNMLVASAYDTSATAALCPACR